MDTSKSIVTNSLMRNEMLSRAISRPHRRSFRASLRTTGLYFSSVSSSARLGLQNQICYLCYKLSARVGQCTSPFMTTHLIDLAQFIITERSSGAHTCDTLACPWCSKIYTTAAWYCSRLRRCSRAYSLGSTLSINCCTCTARLVHVLYCGRQNDRRGQKTTRHCDEIKKMIRARQIFPFPSPW